MNSKKGCVEQLMKRVSQTLSKVSSPKLTGSRVKLRDDEIYFASKPITQYYNLIIVKINYNNNNKNEV